MSVYMRYIRFNLLKTCHLQGVPYSTLAEMHGKVLDFHKDGFMSNPELSEYVLSNTYSALNNLVLRKDSSDIGTCKNPPVKIKNTSDSKNPISYALATGDFDFLYRLVRGVQPARHHVADIHRLKCKRDSSVEQGVVVLSRQNHTLKQRDEPLLMLQQPARVESATLNSVAETVLKSEEHKESGDDEKKERRGADEDQLEKVKQYYIYITPQIVKHGEEIRAGIHHPDIVFENFFFEKPKIVRGFMWYNLELHRLRWLSYLKCTHCGFQVRSITTHMDESCVKLHWRLYYQSQWRLLKFWTLKIGKPAEETFDWVEGFSTFYVNKDGRVIKHRVDRTVPFPMKEKRKNKLFSLNGLLGLAPTAKFWDLYKKKDPPSKEAA